MKRIESLMAGSYPAHSSREKHSSRPNTFFYHFQETVIQDILAKGLSALDKWGSFLSGKLRRTPDPLFDGTLLWKLIAIHEQPIPPKGPDKRMLG